MKAIIIRIGLGICILVAIIAIRYHKIFTQDIDYIAKAGIDWSKPAKTQLLESYGKPDWIYQSSACTETWAYLGIFKHASFTFDENSHMTSNGFGIGWPNRKKPKEVYSKYDGRNNNYTASIKKAFNLAPIDSVKNIVRIFHMPSFRKEMVLEIGMGADQQFLTLITPSGTQIWHDMHEFITDSQGNTIGGKVRKASAYSPTQEAQPSAKTYSTNIAEISDSLYSFGVDKMKSIEYKDIIYIDGTTIYIESNINGATNRFSFRKGCYFDHRYNWISKLTDQYKLKIK